MYSLPSASQIRAPCPFAATTGLPPTPRKALTGELTPPGNSSDERRIISADLSPIAADSYSSHRQTSPRRSHERLHLRRNNPDRRCLEIVVIDNVLDCNFEKSSGRVDFVEIRDSIHIIRLPGKTTD